MFVAKLKYGDGEVAVRLDNAKSITVLDENAMASLQDLPAAFEEAVGNACVDSPALAELIKKDDLVTIVISDITRFWMRQDKIVPLLVDFLHEKIGVAYDSIAILVALGTHRPQTEEELARLVTPRVKEVVRVVNHDCMADDLVCVGQTSRGTEVWVNPLALGRKVIIVSGTMHHLMAGYGGGRKSIVPGIAGKKTINQNHLHSLSPVLPRSNPLIGMGVLAKNPVNEDMNEAAALVNPVFGINIVINSQNEHCALVCGHWKRAWEESCLLIDRVMGVSIGKKADVVIVSCGGYPKDINLYQAVKSLFNAVQAIKEGGLLVFLAECREGGGAPEFFDWIVPLRQGRLDEALRANFSIAGYIFYASCEAIAKADVRILTKIDPKTAGDMKMRAYQDMDTLMREVDVTGKDVFVIPYGGYVVPFLAKSIDN